MAQKRGMKDAFPQIVAAVVVALLVGGTSPWWWKVLRPEKPAGTDQSVPEELIGSYRLLSSRMIPGPGYPKDENPPVSGVMEISASVMTQHLTRADGSSVILSGRVTKLAKATLEVRNDSGTMSNAATLAYTFHGGVLTTTMTTGQYTNTDTWRKTQ